MPVLIEGEIEFEDLSTPVGGVTIYVRIEDISRADAPSVRLSEQVIRGVTLRGPGRPRVPFSVQATLDDPNGQYVVSVHADLNGSGTVEVGDYITTQSHPVSPSSSNSGMVVEVHRVG